jgi:hypothetical protein
MRSLAAWHGLPRWREPLPLATQVRPYHFDFVCNVRARWSGQTMIEVFCSVSLLLCTMGTAGLETSGLGAANIIQQHHPAALPTAPHVTTPAGVPRSEPGVLHGRRGRGSAARRGPPQAARRRAAAPWHAHAPLHTPARAARARYPHTGRRSSCARLPVCLFRRSRTAEGRGWRAAPPHTPAPPRALAATACHCTVPPFHPAIQLMTVNDVMAYAVQLSDPPPWSLPATLPRWWR